MSTYTIYRFYASGKEAEVLDTGLSRHEAEEHCHSPATSSRTATSEEARRRTEEHGEWFDGFQKEEE